MKKSDFHYELPESLIAQQPLPERSASRMLVLQGSNANGNNAALQDRHVRELPELLQPGDLLVFNDTRVLPARLFGRKLSGGRVEILIERLLGGQDARAQLGASKTSRIGTRIALDDGGEVEVLGREGEFYLLRFDGHESLEKRLLRAGRMPLPPYIHRAPGVDDAERYQTVFARELGAVAAPTAGLHFDDALLGRLRARGVGFGTITLHVGAGTFQPMRGERLDQHVMHSEWLNVGATLVEQIAQTRACGGRVIAVGTTVVRALESATVRNQSGECVLRPFAGETRIFIFPGYRIRSVDALLTNFHLPESTLLMLVSAYAGRERVLGAYRHAVEQRYRFFSYGDAMLVFPWDRSRSDGSMADAGNSEQSA
ncbi:MAG TPA: tRNA preQ1(34) S-adenosylmethionine ribosyltransferase-isomerase QueA [Xanthomonadaceae bacterium]|nr:tRNA preQ1(34) S-adenosylmethionine ribosyltransferase-isomerase QueA [Xanthomonadaceae bacterium]